MTDIVYQYQRQPQHQHPLFPDVETAWQSAVPFQVEDVDFIVRNKRVVAGHKTGQGKTFISLLAWSQWQDAKRGLIIGTLSSMATWRKILKKWGGIDPVFIQGYSDPQWQDALHHSQGIWMCTYSTFRGLMQKQAGKVYFDVD